MSLSWRRVPAGLEALKSRGVKYGGARMPVGYIAVFQDPHGNRLQLPEGR